MRRDVLKEQTILLATSAIFVLALVMTLSFWRPDELNSLNIGGLTIDLAANLAELLWTAVAVLMAWLILLNLILLGWRAARDRFRPPIGAGSIPERHFDKVVDAIEGQKQLFAAKAWPEHPATAGTARSPRAIKLGDAIFNVPRKDRRQIRDFVGRPKRGRAAGNLERDMLVVTGEPGAGKSVLGQEIHASLASGVRARRHALIPIVVFASDLTATMLEMGASAPKLRDFLIRYFHSLGTAKYDAFANFLDTDWSNFDFLIIIDGLDEIAQRSIYEEMQWQLRHMIDAELESERRRSRRFILSCRLDDNIGTFGKAQSVVLRGISTAKQQRALCANLIHAHELSPVQRSAVEAALGGTSGHLASVDVFRRNPYFLTVLINYHKKRRGEDVGRTLDFDLLIKDYIAREAERSHATAIAGTGLSLPRRDDLREALEGCATIFLQYLAYHMTTLEQEDALYGQAPISAALIEGFVGAAQQPCGAEASGVWTATRALLERLADKRPLDAAELNAQRATGLDQNDLRLFDQLSLLDRPADESVMQAFSVIALEGRLESLAWYKALANHIAAVGGATLDHPDTRMAGLLMARGLAAAHVLRLIYVEKGEHGPTVRFRHRRLAEYYAASYFRDRWDELQPIPNSPWLKPVLDLVAAIEGERCHSMAWFLERLDRIEGKPVFAWRADVTAAAEVAAFAHHGPNFSALAGRLVRKLLAMLAEVRPAGTVRGDRGGALPRDPVTERTLINALDFVAGLDLGSVQSLKGKTFRSFYLREAKEPSYLLLYSGRAATAVSRLARRPIPWWFSIVCIVKALREPNVLIDQPSEAFESGLAIPWAATLLWMLLVEAALVVVVGWASYQLVLRADSGVGSASGLPLPWIVTLAFVVIWIAWRSLQWRRSPTRAALLARLPIGVLLYGTAGLLTLLAAAVWGALKTPEVLIRGGWTVARNTVSAVRRGPAAARSLVLPVLKAVSLILLTVGAVGVVLIVLQRGEPAVDGRSGVRREGPAPVKWVPTDLTKIPCPASDRLLAYRPPQGRTKDTLAQARRRVASLYEATVEEWARSSCDLKYSRSDGTPSSPLDLLDRLLNRDPLLIPDPEGKPPIFAREALNELRWVGKVPALPERSEGPIGGLLALRDAWILDDHRDDYVELSRALWRTRGTGRVSDRSDGYPAGQAYVSFAREVNGLVQSYRSKRSAFEEKARALRAQGIRALWWWSVLLPMLLLLSAFLLHLRARASDAAALKAIETAPVPDICTALATKPFSDRLRGQLKQVLADREQISQRDLDLIDDLVRKFSSRDRERDRQFAGKLGLIVPPLARRLADR